MKTLTLILAIVFFTLSCNSVENKNEQIVQTSEISSPSLEGVWEMTNQYFYEEGAVMDSLPVGHGYRQVKIYNHGKIMWSRKVPIDSIEWYGYGNYSITDSTLSETLEYGSASILKILDTMRVFNFELLIEKDRFSQITVDDEGNRIMSENYIRIK